MRALPWLLVLGLGRAAAAQCPDGTPPPCSAGARARVAPPAAAERGRRFLILPFRNLSRNPDHAWLVEGSTTMLVEVLSRWQDLSVVPDERLYPALRRARLAPGAVMDPVSVRRVAEETGGWTAVNGEILALGSRIRLSARAYDVVTNREIVRTTEEVRSLEEVRGAYERIGARLLATAGVESAPDLGAITTRSLQAYRAYLRGVAELNRVRPGPARDAFREAMRLDSSFVQAHALFAVATIRHDLFDLFDDSSEAIRAADRADALAARLPPVERRRVRLIADMAHARFTATRAGLDSLLAADSLDLAALDLAIALEPHDLLLVPGPRGFEPRMNRNRWVRLARRQLDLDPERHAAYEALVSAYLDAGHVAPGILWGLSAWSELANSRAPGISPRSVVVLGDSFSYGVTDSVPEAELEASRRRGAAVALQWARRWTAVAPTEGAAHIALARALVASGDTAAGLRSLGVADRLGGGSRGLVSADLLRLAVLARMGRVEQAARGADSLWLAVRDSMPRALRRPLLFSELHPAIVLAIQTGRLGRAAEIIDSILVSARRYFGERQAEAETRIAYPWLLPYRYAVGTAIPRTAAAESLLARLAVGPVPELSGWLGRFLAAAALDDSAAGPRLRRGAMDAARALAAAGDTANAYDVGMFAAADTALRATILAWPWMAQRVAAWRAAAAERQRRFRPLAVTVTTQELVIEWAVNDSTPFVWNRPFTRPGQREFQWTAAYNIRGRLGGWAVIVARAHEARERSGTLAELVADAGRWRVEPRVAPGRLTISRPEPELVAELRRERPRTARVYLVPCRLFPGDPAPPGGCADLELPITYR